MHISLASFIKAVIKWNFHCWSTAALEDLSHKQFYSPSLSVSGQSVHSGSNHSTPALGPLEIQIMQFFSVGIVKAAIHALTSSTDTAAPFDIGWALS